VARTKGRDSFSDKQKIAVYMEYKGKCFDCKKPLCGYWYDEFRLKKPKRTFTIEGANIHHIIPVVKGGKHKMYNWVLLCIPCHHKRHRILGMGE